MMDTKAELRNNVGEQVEIIATATYYQGLIVGWREAASAMRQLSGELYATGSNDIEAIQARRFAEMCEKRAVEKQKYYAPENVKEQAAKTQIDLLLTEK